MSMAEQCHVDVLTLSYDVNMRGSSSCCLMLVNFGSLQAYRHDVRDLLSSDRVRK
jgi:hypothetical protein